MVLQIRFWGLKCNECLREISKFFKHKSKDMFSMLHQQEKQCHVSSVFTTVARMLSMLCMEQLGTTKQVLVLLEKRVELHYHHMVSKWTQMGDKGTLEFFMQ